MAPLQVSLEQQGEAGLLEVPVSGEGLGQPSVAHDYKRNAVRQGPRLVRTCLLQVGTAAHQFGGRREERQTRVGLQSS